MSPNNTQLKHRLDSVPGEGQWLWNENYRYPSKASATELPKAPPEPVSSRQMHRWEQNRPLSGKTPLLQLLTAFVGSCSKLQRIDAQGWPSLCRDKHYTLWERGCRPVLKNPVLALWGMFLWGPLEASCGLSNCYTQDRIKALEEWHWLSICIWFHAERSFQSFWGVIDIWYSIIKKIMCRS